MLAVSVVFEPIGSWSVSPKLRSARANSPVGSRQVYIEAEAAGASLLYLHQPPGEIHRDKAFLFSLIRFERGPGAFDDRNALALAVIHVVCTIRQRVSIKSDKLNFKSLFTKSKNLDGAAPRPTKPELPGTIDLRGRNNFRLLRNIRLGQRQADPKNGK